MCNRHQSEKRESHYERENKNPQEDELSIRYGITT